MSCNSVTLNSIKAKCDTSIGGIKRIFVQQRDYLTDVIVDETTQKIIYLGGFESEGLKVWEFRKNTANYTSTATIDSTINLSYFTTEVSLQFSRAEAQKRLEIQSVINAGGVVVIIEDMYGEFLFLGKDKDVRITAATMQSGTNQTDLSGFNLTFTDTSFELPHFINKEYVDVTTLAKEIEEE